MSLKIKPQYTFLLTAKQMIARTFSNLAWFYQHLRGKIFIAVSLNVLVGILDGFGLAMFLPLLQMAQGEQHANPDKMGNLGFLISWLKERDIDLNLTAVLLIIVFFFLTKGLIYYVQGVYQVGVQQFFIKKIRISNINLLKELSYKYFLTADAGRIQNTLTAEVDRVSRAYQYYFQSFQMGVMVMVYMSFAFFVDWKFAIMVSIGGALSNFLYKKIYTHTRSRSYQLTQDTSIFQGLIIQAVGHFKYLKASGKLNQYGDKLSRQVENIEQNNLKIGVLGIVLLATREPMIIMIVCGVILLQTTVIGSPLSVILVSLLFFYRALNALMYMQTAWNTFLGASGSLQNMTEFTNELQRNKENIGPVLLDSFKSEIRLKQLSFSYGTKKILNQVDLCIQHKKTYAFVGSSGSGKTTLMNILCGLIPPDSGTMAVDGINVNQLNIPGYQQRIGYITQDPVIFNDTIYNNISFWAEKTPESESRFKQACQKAAIWDFICNTSKAEETVLGNNGINLSGGQKQRVAIARELFKEIDLLILDEATSSLDSETEMEIQKNIDALSGQYTILIIAHRLSTVRTADHIAYLQKGNLIIADSIHELAIKVPEFNNMARQQMMITDAEMLIK